MAPTTIAIILVVIACAAELEVDVDIDSVFPRALLAPEEKPSSFCQFELRGIFESVPALNYFNPEHDSELGDTRVAFDGLSWSVSSQHSTYVVAGKPQLVARDTANNDTTNSSSSEEDVVVQLRTTPFGQLVLNFTPMAERVHLAVEVQDYEWASSSASAVLVFEWEVVAGYNVDESMISRQQRSIAVGGCMYNANQDAHDENNHAVRCEVRTKGNGDGRGAYLWQSYAHFARRVTHPNATLAATVIAEPTNAASTKLLSSTAVAFVVVVVATTAGFFF